MDQSYWKEQLQKYRTHSLTGAEEELLWEAWADAANAEGWKQIMGELFREQRPTSEYRTADWEPVLQTVFNSDQPQQPVVASRGEFVRRFAVAAVLIALLGTGVWWIIHQRPATTQPIVQATKLNVPAPATNRATITLGNGRQIYLDSAGNGALARQGNAQVVKLANGQVAYKVENMISRVTLFNTLTNPRGSQVVNLTLSDGTRVWLNAESSIRYPVVFTGQDRSVEIKGEGYFEVAQNPNKPFKVQQGMTTIEVLGTAFNVNAYADEPALKVTLLDGKLRVEKEGTNVLLQPGQQAQVATGIQLNKGVDLVAVMAWKNGLFSFHDADLPAVMRQLARWYNIDVDYEGHIPQEKFQFNGKMGKDLTLNNVLDLLTNARVHYTIEAGNKLLIRP